MVYIFLGLGRSGLCAADFMNGCGHTVLVWDDNQSRVQEASSRGLSLCTLQELQQIIQQSPHVTLVASPGIATHTLKDHCFRKGHRVICDIQLFFDLFPDIQAIGVTGSNGKSTTCALIHHALQSQGEESILAGNIGVPIFSTLVEGRPQKGLYVLELSSYQLELCDRLFLQVGVLLNVVPHHLERHGSLEAYQQIKEKIFSFSSVIIGAPEFQKNYPDLVDYTGTTMDTSDIPEGFSRMPGILNVQAAYSVLKALGYGSSRAMKTFRSLPHRQELVGCFQGIQYWNDSKATTPHAAACGISALAGGLVYWIGGGVLQEDSLDPFAQVASSITIAFLMGQAADRYQKFFSSLGVKTVHVSDLGQAVDQATKAALSEKSVSQSAHIILSPGCASFDQFQDFEHRGDTFKKIVHSTWSQCHVA